MAKEAKSYQPSFGAMIPARAMVDTRLTGTSLRLVSVYAFHDRMSLTLGKGDGCTASNKRIISILGCDYTTLIKLRSQLIEWGYIRLEPRRGGKRLEVVRVIPDHLAFPECWPFDQSFIGFKALETWGVSPDKVGEIAKLWFAKVGGAANMPLENVGDANFETPENPPKTDNQYIPLSGEIYSSEEGEYNAPNARDEVSQKIHSAEAGLPRASLRRYLPDNFDELLSQAQVPCIERAFKAVGSDPELIIPRERQEISSLLVSISEAYSDDPIGQQAARLYGEIAAF